MATPPPAQIAVPEPPRRRPTERRALIRPISQSMLRLKPIVGQDRFRATIEMILRWMGNRAGRPLPAAASELKSFDLVDVGAQRVSGVALETPRYWAGRLDDADKNVPLRTWVTEIGVGQEDNGDVIFGARLICTTRGDDLPFTRSIPGFIWQIWQSGPAELDGQLVGPDPLVVSNEPEVERLLTLLESRDRRAPVIIFALPDGCQDASVTAANAALVHKSTVGAAHVVILTGPASFHLTDRVGRELSVFRQSVRVYVPPFRAWFDEPYRHPLVLPERIAAWPDGGPRAFEQWLVSEALSLSIRRPDREQVLPSFMDIRQLSAESTRRAAQSAGGTAEELLGLSEQYIETMKREFDEDKQTFEALLREAEKEREAALAQAQQERWSSMAL